MTKQPLVVLEGFKTFQKFLRTEKSRFSASPILLLVSQADTRQGKPDQRVDQTCRRAEFLLQQGFRTILSHPLKAGYVFPTDSDLENATDLASRIGASTVAAVGSGGVMDLAKAMTHNIEEVLLVPATYGAALSAGSSSSLLLDPSDETLMVRPSDRAETSRTIAVIEQSGDNISGDLETTAVYACMTLALDGVLRDKNDEIIEDRISKLAKLLASPPGQSLSSVTSLQVSQMLIEAGETISYGLSGNSRSTPMALAAALVPKVFPQYNILTFLASLSESVFHEVERQQRVMGDIHPQFQSMPRVLTAEPIQVLLAKIRENRASWGCRDLSDDVLSRILAECVV